jgi:hypothetical protein
VARPDYNSTHYREIPGGLELTRAGLMAKMGHNFTASAAPAAGDDSVDGYYAGSIWVDATALTGGVYVCSDASVGAAVWKRILITSQYLRTTGADPTANDDSGDGYQVGTLWINTTDDRAFVCADNTLTAAVWRELADLQRLALTTASNGASLIGLQDAATYYAGAQVEAALTALGVQLGGDTDATFNFTDETIVADDDAVYAALDKLDQQWTSAILTSPAGTITDPSDAGAIPVTGGGVCPLATTGVVDTRTLAAPTFMGQILTLSFAVDNGDAVVTCASGVNQTGNNTLTFSDIGEEITLRAVGTAPATLRWRVLSNDGVVLSTV